MASPLFGLVPAGLPLITDPTEAPSQTSYIYSIPPAKAFNHITVFLLPNITLPPGTAAAIYLITPPAPGSSELQNKFLGGVGPGKESAVFKISAGAQSNTVVGISIEDGASVGTRIEELKANSSALVPASGQKPTTLVLAQRIIQNAFDFMSSFSGQAGNVEVVPLKAFEGWWKKFESRIRSDPGFLEREQ